ncbi:hypothetical protein COV18_00155 [Candidatus Woesearchaeota archaeon CG10_big_fil_rev_8_21_14_0_10_37_12]|nr:MAG: hypothetical protein COV18_00155 [Candidatus Woesearchaeota archaeon CG10_big_fil_rev_8_21_14_0_10_37_12]
MGGQGEYDLARARGDYKRKLDERSAALDARERELVDRSSELDGLEENLFNRYGLKLEELDGRDYELGGLKSIVKPAQPLPLLSAMISSYRKLDWPMPDRNDDHYRTVFRNSNGVALRHSWGQGKQGEFYVPGTLRERVILSLKADDTNSKLLEVRFSLYERVMGKVIVPQMITVASADESMVARATGELADVYTQLIESMKSGPILNLPGGGSAPLPSWWGMFAGKNTFEDDTLDQLANGICGWLDFVDRTRLPD